MSLDARTVESKIPDTNCVNEDSDIEVITTRVLRSQKRKLEKCEKDVNKTRKRKKMRINPMSKASKKKRNSANIKNCIVTSTPLREGPKIPNFNESCIIPDTNKDVIVISDSSASTLPVIVLTDGESDSEIQILPPSEIRSNDNNLLEYTIDKNRTINRKKRRCKKSSGMPSENRQLKTSLVGENIYVEHPIVLPTSGLRPIIIDGSNVAYSHSNNLFFSCKGLDICIKYFKKRGHQVIAFVPHFRIQQNKSDNPKLLDTLVKSGDVVLTPSRTVDGNAVVSYDDRFIVQTAVLKGGIIVSMDNYRDLLAENPAWADTIKYRLLQFTWVEDVLMFPSDPLGENGPSLERFLRFG